MVDQNLISDLHELHAELDDELNSLFGSNEGVEQVTAQMDQTGRGERCVCLLPVADAGHPASEAPTSQ